MQTDLTGSETLVALTSGAPGTLTSNLAFTEGTAFGTYAYFAADGGYLYRMGPGAPATPAPVNLGRLAQDARALAFGPGGAWGEDLYVATSNVTNGFDDTPGAIVVVPSSGVGVASTFVPYATGLEFGIDLLFDRVGNFGGDLLYKQVDGQVWRVDATGVTTPLLVGDPGVTRLAQLPDGALVVEAGNALFRVQAP